MNAVVVFLICFVASSLGGVCGIGGGVVIKPLLDALGLMNVSVASFLSGLTVLSMSAVNVYKNRKGNELDVKRSIPLGIGSAFGGIIGKKLFNILKQAVSADNGVGKVQATVLGLLVFGTFLFVINKKRIHTKNIVNPVASTSIGLALGMCSAFLGIGGGPMNLTVLYYFFSMDTKKASVNSILVILISQTASLFVTLVTRSVPAFDSFILLAMVIAGILGGAISAKLHKKLDAHIIDVLFSFLLIVIIAICILNFIKFS